MGPSNTHMDGGCCWLAEPVACTTTHACHLGARYVDQPESSYAGNQRTKLIGRQPCMQVGSLHSLSPCQADHAAGAVSDSLFEECMCVPGLCVRVVGVLELLVQAQQTQAGTLLLLCAAVQPLLSFSQCQ